MKNVNKMYAIYVVIRNRFHCTDDSSAIRDNKTNILHSVFKKKKSNILRNRNSHHDKLLCYWGIHKRI